MPSTSDFKISKILHIFEDRNPPSKRPQNFLQSFDGVFPESIFTVFELPKSIKAFLHYLSTIKARTKFSGVTPSSSSPNFYAKLLPSPSQKLSDSFRMTEISQSFFELCECKEKSVGRPVSWSVGRSVGQVHTNLRFYRPCHWPLHHCCATPQKGPWRAGSHVTPETRFLCCLPFAAVGWNSAPFIGSQMVTIMCLAVP